MLLVHCCAVICLLMEGLSCTEAPSVPQSWVWAGGVYQDPTASFLSRPTLHISLYIKGKLRQLITLLFPDLKNLITLNELSQMPKVKAIMAFSASIKLLIHCHTLEIV